MPMQLLFYRFIYLYFVIFLLYLYPFVALRELFRAKLDCLSSDFSSGEMIKDSSSFQSTQELKIEVQNRLENGQSKKNMEEEAVKTPSEHSSLFGLNDAADEFFDVSEPLDYDQSENGWNSDFAPEMYFQVLVTSYHFLILLGVRT